MTRELNERNRKVLHQVVQTFIQSGEPVGSRTVSKRSGLNLSAASIRNVMADLEEMGLLRQPHTSAGRVPTEHGFRLYIDSTLEVEQLSLRERGAIEENLTIKAHDVSGMLKETSRVLSRLSKYMGVVVAPKISSVALKCIEFIQLREKTVLAILVDQTGLVQNKIIDTQDTVSQNDLDKYTCYLNELLQNLTLDEIKRKIVKEMQKGKNCFDGHMSKALRLSVQAFQDIGEKEVYIEGRSNFLDQPEFANVEAMKKILQTFEEKTVLVELLDKTMNAEGVKIFIGTEHNLGNLDGVSVVTSTYKKDYFPLGVLAVIGPTRMNYSKVIPIVDYTAKMVTHYFDNM
jgi:heat-inducible transcriptional repressor